MSKPERLASLPPAVPERCNVLLLGSMPGAASLAAAQYYAHPRNLFWPFMQELFGVQTDAPYQERVEQLNAADVGLWDVLRHCERPGSLDSSIKRTSEEPNDLPGLLHAHPEIRVIGCNGTKAFQLLKRHSVPELPETPAVVQLPSTSPANMSIPYAVKLQRWRDALRTSPDHPRQQLAS